jgi:hypothetical protein
MNYEFGLNHLALFFTSQTFQDKATKVILEEAFKHGAFQSSLRTFFGIRYFFPQCLHFTLLLFEESR